MGSGSVGAWFRLSGCPQSYVEVPCGLDRLWTWRDLRTSRQQTVDCAGLCLCQIFSLVTPAHISLIKLHLFQSLLDPVSYFG